MTKTNEPQDPLKATQNESKGTSSLSNDDGWGEPTPPVESGWDQEIPGDDSWEQKASSSDDSWQQTPAGDDQNKDLWSDNLNSESVEEAFLALIQSNKPQEEAITTPDITASSENTSDLAMQSNFGQSAPATPVKASVEDEANAFYSMSQSPLETSVNNTTAAENELKPFQAAAAEEGSLHERLAEEIFSDMRADELPEVTVTEGQSITDALSETIAESLAELQSGQAVAETAELADQVRQELASQPPAMPEFSNNNPADTYQAKQPEPNVPPQEFVPNVMPYAALEENLGKPNNNDVVDQQHTQPISFENQKTTPPHNLKQPQEPQYTREFPTVGAPAEMNPPNAIQVETQSGGQRTNVDPEFQALVQWNNSGVEPSHQGPNDIPNFLSQKREEESSFNFKTVFISLGITAVVVSMFYMGFQAGRVKAPGEGGTEKYVDATGQNDRGIVVETPGNSTAKNMFSNNNNESEQQQPVRQVKVRPAQKPKASISVFSVKDLNGTSGKEIPMNIRLEGSNLGLKTMLLFRGIPNEIELSKGLKRENLWSVPISDLKTLSLVVPTNYKGQFSFEVFAFKDKESSPERRLASVSIASQPSVARTDFNSNIGFTPKSKQPAERTEQKVAAIPPQAGNFGNEAKNTRPVEQRPAQRPVRQRQPAAPVVSPHVEKSMMQRGNELLKNGDVSGARLVFEHIASLGSKHAAFALARTYDEDFIDDLLPAGVIGEKELAVKWYKKAAALGHREAETRLAKLGLR